MSTEAKRAGNARYLAKFKTIAVRVKPEEADAIQAAADTAGESVAKYITGSIRARMTGQTDINADMNHAPVEEGSELVKLPAGYMSIARAAAELDGKGPEPWICQAIEEQNARDARARELRELLKAKEG